MFINSCILLAFAYVVKAAVVINVFEDGEMKASHSISGCNLRECDRFCRSAGFKKGSCVGNRCRCTSFVALTEHKADHSIRDSCNYQACDQLCRRLGFPGGACVGDKCDCDNFEPNGLTENNSDSSVHDSCNNQDCDQLCRKFDFPGGICAGGKCVCGNFEPYGVKGHSVRDSCHYQACDLICRSLGFPGGACIGDKCKCDNFEPMKVKGSELYAEVEGSEQSDSEEDTEMSLKDVLKGSVGYCDTAMCNDMCRNLNYAGGMCTGGSCQCY